MYEWSELIKLWEHDQVTQTQVIGQLLKHGEGQHTLTLSLLRRLEQVEQTLATLSAGIQPPPVPPGKSAPARR
jgi:hypothetical protein